METLTAQELIDNLHADTNCELAQDVRTIGMYMPSMLLELTALYIARDYNRMLRMITEKAYHAKRICN